MTAQKQRLGQRMLELFRNDEWRARWQKATQCGLERMPPSDRIVAQIRSKRRQKELRESRCTTQT